MVAGVFLTLFIIILEEPEHHPCERIFKAMATLNVARYTITNSSEQIG